MIFLSASIPIKGRNEDRYLNTADLFAIRDSVRALATVVIPKTRLVWGGHPAITPLIRFVVTNFMQKNIQDHVTVYQSAFFTQQFPKDNDFFENVRITENRGERESSLVEMRLRMFTENRFLAGVFIGGMNGVEDEFHLFREVHPEAAIFPIASTGAAAKIIYESIHPKLNERLANDYAYMALFRSLFKEIIK